MSNETPCPTPERLVEIKEHAEALTYAPTRLAAMELFAEIDRLNDLVAKWRDEASALMARAMVAELAAGRARLVEGAANAGS